MLRTHFAVAVLGLVAIAFGARAVRAQDAVFEGVDGPGFSTTRAFAVSPDGTVVVGFGFSGTGNEAFRWTSGGGLLALGDLPGGNFNSGAAGVSEAGAVVVGTGQVDDPLAQLNSRSEAFRIAGGMVGLGDLDGGIFNSIGKGVSADGSVVVGSGQRSDPLVPTTSRSEAFRWTEGGGMVGLGDLEGGIFSSAANAVSGDGTTIVGISTSASGSEAFRWTEALLMEGLGGSSVANAVSANGSVIVGEDSSSGNAFAFRWTEAEGRVSLGDLPDGNVGSVANAVSADGSVVVGRGWSSVGFEAFVWDAAHGMRSLKTVLISELAADIADWDLNTANGISADGRVIVGQGFNPDDVESGWIARLPEPASALSHATAIVALVSIHRRVSRNWRR